MEKMCKDSIYTLSFLNEGKENRVVKKIFMELYDNGKWLGEGSEFGRFTIIEEADAIEVDFCAEGKKTFIEHILPFAAKLSNADLEQDAVQIVGVIRNHEKASTVFELVCLESGLALIHSLDCENDMDEEELFNARPEVEYLPLQEYVMQMVQPGMIEEYTYEQDPGMREMVLAYLDMEQD